LPVSTTTFFIVTKNAGFCNRKFFIIVIFYHYGVIKRLFKYKMKQGDSKLAF